jgi:hypothetical protein
MKHAKLPETMKGFPRRSQRMLSDEWVACVLLCTSQGRVHAYTMLQLSMDKSCFVKDDKANCCFFPHSSAYA